MTVPTRDEILDALRIPDIEPKLDRLGRVVQKNNYNHVRGAKIYYKQVSTKTVASVKKALLQG